MTYFSTAFIFLTHVHFEQAMVEKARFCSPWLWAGATWQLERGIM